MSSGALQRMYYLNKLRLAISGIMLIFAVVHTVWPDLAIDAITLALLGIAVTPWLFQLVMQTL